MKKMGFTLIELLAVIIILGLLSVLIVPKVTNSLNESEEKTNMTSAQNLLKAAEYKVANNEITGTPQTANINYTNGTNIDYLDYTGSKPEKGKVDIRANGKIAMSVKFGDYCYQKEYDSSNIYVISYSEDSCGENADFIINHETPELTTTGDGLYESQTEQGRLIYRGSNPNNYINLKENGTNNTLYRIISYEEDGTIKVVRDERILRADRTEGGIAWDAENARKSDGTNNTYCLFAACNVWGNQTNTLYKGESLGDNFHYSYYNSPDATTLTDGESGTVNDEATLNKYLNSGSWSPLEYLESYIDNHKFNVGGVYYPYYTTISYNDDKGKQREKEEEKLYTWRGKIGLLNITEYSEASLNDNCDVFTNYYFNPKYYYKDEGADKESLHTPSTGWPCKEKNWTFKSYDQWSLSPVSTNRHNAWTVDSVGYFTGMNSHFTYDSVRPAFYLKLNIKLGGSGTRSDPYYIID